MKKMLNRMGISDNIINQMIDIFPKLLEMNTNEFLQKIIFLKELGCDKFQIKNIIISNPNYLNKSYRDLIKLISKMKRFGFDSFNILFDANPFILNLDSYEIENYIIKRKDEGEKIENIVDDLISKPYLFDEI